MNEEIAAASGNFSIRRAKPMDAAAIALVHDQSRRKAYAGLLDQAVLDTMTLSDREAYWKRKLVATGPTIFVVENNQSTSAKSLEICGFVALEQDPMRNTGEIDRIYVAPEQQRQGAGRLMFEQAKAHLRDFGYEKLLIWVFEANTPARKFYESFGMKLDGAERKFPPFPKELRYSLVIEPW